MADIAFLLLIFFLVTTTIASDKGLPLVLPPEMLDSDPLKVHDRNVLAILVNSSDQLLVEGERLENLDDLKEKITVFILNEGKNPELSDSPAEAIVSLRTDRHTSQRRFIEVLDVIHASYNSLYADRLGVSIRDWLRITSSLQDPESKKKFDQARGKQADGSFLYPMQISIAEPVNTQVN